MVAPDIRVRPDFYNIYSLFFFHTCLHTHAYYNTRIKISVGHRDVLVVVNRRPVTIYILCTYI